MHPIFYVFLALLSGVLLPFQVGINSRLKFFLGNSFLAALVSFFCGTVALLIFLVIARISFTPISPIKDMPGWIFIGGILGAAYVGGSIFLSQHLEASFLFTLLIAGQILASVLLDHFGWLGFPKHAIHPYRIAGILLMVAGIWLIKKF